MIVEEKAIILSVRKFQESKLIIKCFFETSGVISGLSRVKGKFAQIPNCGSIIKAKWNARLEEHLGFVDYEPIYDTLAYISNDYRAILVLNSILNLAESLILEKQGHGLLFDAIHDLILSLQRCDILKRYAIFEAIHLLNETGFGLDLSKCVVTGEKDDLIYVSPNSSSAVSKKIGEPYHNKLLKLPKFLITHDSSASTEDIINSLKISLFFLDKYIFKPLSRDIPSSRRLLSDYINSQQSF